MDERIIKSQIHLIRHSITEGNKKRWYYGSIDIPLIEEGIEEVKRLVAKGIYPCQNILSEMSKKVNTGYYTRYYTSGMLRAEQTFKLIYGDIPRETIAGFRELSFGIFEGKSHQELEKEQAYQDWINNYGSAPPEGESHQEFGDRIKKAFNCLCRQHEERVNACRAAFLEKPDGEGDVSPEAVHTIVVCHGGVIGALMMGLFPDEDRHVYSWTPDPAHGYTLELSGGSVVGYRGF